MSEDYFEIVEKKYEVVFRTETTGGLTEESISVDSIGEGYKLVAERASMTSHLPEDEISAWTFYIQLGPQMKRTLVDEPDFRTTWRVKA